MRMTTSSGSTTRSRSVPTALVVAALVAGMLLWWGAGAGTGGAAEGSAPGQAELQRQFEELVASQREATQAAGVTPYLEDVAQRRLWIASYERMTVCFAEHGFAGASDVPETFGDGKTPVPMIDASQPNAERALASCPLDLEGVDQRALAAAITAEAPPGASG